MGSSTAFHKFLDYCLLRKRPKAILMDPAAFLGQKGDFEGLVRKNRQILVNLGSLCLTLSGGLDIMSGSLWVILHGRLRLSIAFGEWQ